MHTNHVDTVIGAEPSSRLLYEGITDFQVEAAYEFRNDDLQWIEEIDNPSLPIALKVTLTTEQFGVIERIFQVAL